MRIRLIINRCGYVTNSNHMVRALFQSRSQDPLYQTRKRSRRHSEYLQVAVCFDFNLIVRGKELCVLSNVNQFIIIFKGLTPRLAFSWRKTATQQQNNGLRIICSFECWPCDNEDDFDKQTYKQTLFSCSGGDHETQYKEGYKETLSSVGEFHDWRLDEWKDQRCTAISLTLRIQIWTSTTYTGITREHIIPWVHTMSEGSPLYSSNKKSC